MNTLPILFLWFQLFIGSFSALSFRDAKQLQESISKSNDVGILTLLKGDAREYSGFSIAAFMLSLWITLSSFVLLIFFFNLYSISIAVLSLGLPIFFFRHWQNSNYLHSECMTRISLNTP